MTNDPADGWVNPVHIPRYGDALRAGPIPVGIPHKTKVLMVHWLILRYNFDHDKAMREVDALERYLEKNS